MARRQKRCSAAPSAAGTYSFLRGASCAHTKLVQGYADHCSSQKDWEIVMSFMDDASPSCAPMIASPPLRPLALTVEEQTPGEFRWSIIESVPTGSPRILAISEACFAAYDTALATGYGELQRLIGPELQYGPRSESPVSYQPSRLPEVAARLDGKTLSASALTKLETS